VDRGCICNLHVSISYVTTRTLEGRGWACRRRTQCVGAPSSGRHTTTYLKEGDNDSNYILLFFCIDLRLRRTNYTQDAAMWNVYRIIIILHIITYLNNLLSIKRKGGKGGGVCLCICLCVCKSEWAHAVIGPRATTCERVDIARGYDWPRSAAWPKDRLKAQTKAIARGQGIHGQGKNNGQGNLHNGPFTLAQRKTGPGRA
jgi:hypothetical protein